MTDMSTVLLQYGPLGAMAVGLVYAVVHMYKRETQRADKAEANLEVLRADLKASNAAMVELAEKVTAAVMVLQTSQREVQQ